jgi:hypothetical protein
MRSTHLILVVFAKYLKLSYGFFLLLDLNLEALYDIVLYLTLSADLVELFLQLDHFLLEFKLGKLYVKFNVLHCLLSLLDVHGPDVLVVALFDDGQMLVEELSVEVDHRFGQH